MSDSTFYSDRIGKTTPRTIEDVSESAWYGLAALIRRYLSDGSLARAFPERDCPDGNSITGTDEELFLDSLAGFIPGISRDVLTEDQRPDTTTVLDIIDFIALHIDQPRSRSPHSFLRHEHLYFSGHNADSPFDELLTPGQKRFQQDVDLLFRRNGIAFTVDDDMRVHRLGPPEAHPLLSDLKPDSGNPQFDAKLNDAMTRFLSRTPAEHRDALEKLWDAFEQLKRLEPRKDTKQSVAQLLDRAVPGPFRAELDAEFKTLSDIGNGFSIRHHGPDQNPLPSDAAVDYLFIRLTSAIAFVLRQTGRLTR